jgi:hypothetical protein
MKMADLESGWHAITFDVRRSVRYHLYRRRTYERFDKFTNMLSVIFGSAAVYGMLEANWRPLALSAAAVVTIFSTINLVIGSSQRAREHGDLARRFIDLEKRLLGEPNPEALHQVKQERLTIEAEEPPPLLVLDCMCHNDQLRAEGYDDTYLAHIRSWQKLFAPFIDIRPGLIKVSKYEAEASDARIDQQQLKPGGNFGGNSESGIA